MKIPIIKKGEYDIWSMRMRQYICHTDHNLWDIIVNGDLQEEDAIKSRFGGNDESKKIHRNVLKHQFENFTTILNESLDKAYDRFQKLISQLEVYAAPVYEDKMKRSLSSTSNSQNLAFLSSENTSSTNEVSPVNRNFRVNIAGGTSSSSQVSSTPSADEVVAMLTVRVQRFIQKIGRNLDFKGKQLVTFEKSKVECYNYHRNGHFAKECKSGRNQGGYDWSNDFNEPVNYALMAISSSSSSISSDNKIKWLGFGTQLDDWSNKFETDSEISMSFFEVRSSDEEITLANDRFSKADGYHVVPPPITGNFLNPRAGISFAGLDEYAIRKKIIESKTTQPKDDTSEPKTSETVDDEDDVSDLNTATSVKTNETQTVKTKVDKIGQISQKEGIGFLRK
ncbi:hypothetical protein Tco_1344958 [Tanacetum coccineum]